MQAVEQHGTIGKICETRQLPKTIRFSVHTTSDLSNDTASADATCMQSPRRRYAAAVTHLEQEDTMRYMVSVNASEHRDERH